MPPEDPNALPHSRQDHPSEKNIPASDASVSPRKRFASERLKMMANTLTIIVALSAIALTVWEGMENRLHNRLSVLPHLEDAGSTIREGTEDSTYTLTYALANTGLGPAVLQNILIFRDGEPVFNAVQSGRSVNFSDLLAELQELPFHVSSLTHGRRADELLQAGAEHLLIRMEVPLVDTLDRWTPGIVHARVMNHYSFVFCYCSVYGDNCGVTYLSAAPPSGEVCSR